MKTNIEIKMKNIAIDIICWILNNVVFRIFKSIGYTFTYEVKISDFK